VSRSATTRARIGPRARHRRASGGRALKIGLQLSRYDFAGGPAALRQTLARIAEAAERAGFSYISVPDHLWQLPAMDGPAADMLEAYTTLGFLAAHTERVALLSVVSPVNFRYPAMLAKSVTTLDVLSGGRAWLGLGAGSAADEDESRGMGVPCPPLRDRYVALEDTVRICLRLWSGDESPFAGEVHSLARPLNRPQSLTRPHPPILIAGEGERRTLKLVARYADAAGLRPTPDLPHKLEVLRRHCETEGRDYDAIEKTCNLTFDVGADGSQTADLIKQLQGVAAQGIDTVFGREVAHVDRIAPIEAIGREVIPAVRDL
jgi:F420-dependent oxidoreductase-like protein